jgi:hypothetical protein
MHAVTFTEGKRLPGFPRAMFTIHLPPLHQDQSYPLLLPPLRQHRLLPHPRLRRDCPLLPRPRLPRHRLPGRNVLALARPCDDVGQSHVPRVVLSLPVSLLWVVVLRLLSVSFWHHFFSFSFSWRVSWFFSSWFCPFFF